MLLTTFFFCEINYWLLGSLLTLFICHWHLGFFLQQEYETLGKLIREITLEPELDFLRDAVQLPSTNMFVVCQGLVAERNHRVCLVDQCGRIKASYGTDAGSSSRLNTPIQVVHTTHMPCLFQDLLLRLPSWCAAGFALVLFTKHRMFTFLQRLLWQRPPCNCKHVYAGGTMVISHGL